MHTHATDQSIYGRVVQWSQTVPYCGTHSGPCMDIPSHLMYIFLSLLGHVELLQGRHEGLPVAMLQVVRMCDVCQAACLIQCFLRLRATTRNRRGAWLVL